MTGRAYNGDQVIKMESELLQVLEFNFTFPTSLSFLETYMTALGATDLPTELYTRYLLELSLT